MAEREITSASAGVKAQSGRVIEGISLALCTLKFKRV